MSLSLPERSGLPDEIAYLRNTYPKTAWAAHPNYGEMANFWLHVHASLREHGAQLKAGVDARREDRWPAGQDFQRFFVGRINEFLGHLDGHHRIEDAAYFPKFRALDPRMVAGFDLLEQDHGLIHQQLGATVDAARAMLPTLGQPGDAQRAALDAYASAGDRLLDLLLRHLADEEDLVIPAILEHGERRIA